MATQAYVFVYATPGTVEAAATPKALGQLVLQKVQRAPGVEATDTRILVEV